MYECTRRKRVCLIGRERFKARSSVKSTQWRIITCEKKKVVENSVENALYETYIVSIQVYGYIRTTPRERTQRFMQHQR